MNTQDAVKARIKKLEGDMLGLLYRLNRLRTCSASGPNSFSSVSNAFNAKTARADMTIAFHNAGMVQNILNRQISEIRDELTQLTQSYIPAPEFRLAA